MKNWKTALLLISGIGFSNLGNWIYFVAINIKILDLTGSAAAVAGLFVIKPIAQLFTNLWSGSIIDRINVRKLMIFVDIVRGCLVFIIPFLSSLWVIYVMIFMISLFGSFFGPSSSVYMTKIVPTEDRQRFNSMMSMVNSGAFLLGPAISGLLIMTVDADFCIIFNAISFIVCALIIFMLPNVDRNPESVKPMTKKLLIEDWQVIGKFITTAKYFFIIYVLFQLAMLIGYSVDSQEATFIRLHLRLSVSDYGMIISLTGVGALVGSSIAAMMAKKISYRWYMSAGTVLSTLFYITFYASFNFITAAVSFVLLGFFMSFAGAGYTTFVQNHVPVSIMGRFASLAEVSQGLVQIVLTLIIGFISEFISLQFVCLAVCGLALILGIVLIIKVQFSPPSDASLAIKR
ncbi:MFS transporter [Cohnella lupini]|uniref:MFS transporter n=2 Tax=Cohnella lupini TaxID=1294267 RepID=A0A3D9IC52_9BACL|nr:MFS transporter [Cohnella lupini]RED59352.1 MFS transporter [Cohnella lupini]